MITEIDLEGKLNKYNELEENIQNMSRENYFEQTDKIDDELSEYLGENSIYISENFEVSGTTLSSSNLIVHFFKDFIEIEFLTKDGFIEQDVIKENLTLKQVVDFLNDLDSALDYIIQDPKKNIISYFK